jgi:hypothetical protein
MSTAGTSRDGVAAKAIALMSAVLVGLACGIVAVLLQQIYAPFGVFPLLVGMLTGAVTLLPLLIVRPRKFGLAIAAALAASLGCTAAHHYGTFLWARSEMARDAERIADARRALEGPDAAVQIAIDTPQPITLAEYYDFQWQVGRPLGETKIRGPMLAAWWVLDGLLVWLGAAIITSSFTTRPARPATQSSVPVAQGSVPENRTTDDLGPSKPVDRTPG